MENLSKLVVAVFIVFVCLVLVAGLGTSATVAAPPTVQTMPGRLLEMRLIDDPRPIRIPAPPGFDPKRRAPNAAPIVLNYVTTGRLGDTCTTMPSAARTAFEYAASLAAAQFNSSVTTTIDACWVTNFPPGNILGNGGAIGFRLGFPEAPVASTWYADALANALHGSDFDSVNHEIYIGYNANQSNWYYGIDGNPGTKIDLVSVAYHEIFHGLGFLPSFAYSGGTGQWGLELSAPYRPAAYDRFVYNGSGQLLITAFTNPSTALGSQLVGNNIFFRGTNATAANGGTYPKLYAPISWADGSSISHLDQSTFTCNV